MQKNELQEEQKSDLSYSITGSAAFDRVTNTKDKTKKTNALIRRVQFGASTLGDANYIQLHQVRAVASSATDFDARSKVTAAEFEYEPTVFDLAMGVAHPFFNLVDYRWHVIAHAEYGGVVDADGKKELLPIEHSDFLRLGPKLQLELWPSDPALSGLSFTLAYTHLNDTLNGGDGSDFFSALGKYKLDKKGNYFLTLHYRNGQTPLVKDNVNTFTVGIGLKF